MENKNQNLNIVGVLEMGYSPYGWDASTILDWGDDTETNNSHLLSMVAVLGSVVPVATYGGCVYLPVVEVSRGVDE